MNLLSNSEMQELATEVVTTSLKGTRAEARAKEITESDLHHEEDWHLYQDILDHCDTLLLRDPVYSAIFFKLNTEQKEYHGSMMRECMYKEIDKFFEQHKLNH